MIEIEEARYALSVAREYAEEGNYTACAAVVEKLIGMFPSSYRFGRDVALAIGAPEWGIDWAGLDAEITGAINAQIIEELRRRDKVAVRNKANAKNDRTSKYAWVKVIAEKVVAQKPNLSDNQLAALVLDAAQSVCEGHRELPSDRTVRGWIQKIRGK